MLSGTRLLNLGAMMKSGTYNHSKWSEYMVTNHQRHFSLKSCSGRVDNFHRVPISGGHCSPVIQPKWSTLCSINAPSYRCISTTKMFFYTSPNNNTDPSDGNKQLPNDNNSSNSYSHISWMRSWMPTIPTQQPSDDIFGAKQQSNNWQWWYKVRLIGGSSVVISWLFIMIAWEEEQRKVANVDKAILKGTKPNPVPIHSPAVDRQEIIDEVAGRFINKKDTDEGATSFGVILGPTGTGKTHIVIQACFQHPKGVLYCDIMTIGDIAKCLAEVAGMRIEPTFLGKLAGHFFGSPISYYRLPDDDTLATTYVIKEIAKRSEVLKNRLDRPVCLFIDGVDIIAKHDKDFFIRLVDLAKGLANKRSLRLILVSSEGHIIPLLKKTSSQSRSDIMEILDITEAQAVDYLYGQGLSNELAKDIVDIAGPRVLFCYHAINEYHKYPEKKDVLNRIVNRLHTKFVYSATQVFIMGKPATARVIQALLESEHAKARFDPFAFLEACIDEEKRAKLARAIDALVKANALRYCGDSTVAWHNKLACTDILNRLNNIVPCQTET